MLPRKTRSTPACSCCRNSPAPRSEEHTSEIQSPYEIVCRLLLEKKKKAIETKPHTAMESRLTDMYARRCLAASSTRITRCGSKNRMTIFAFAAAAATEIYTLSLHDALPIY